MVFRTGLLPPLRVVRLVVVLLVQHALAAGLCATGALGLDFLLLGLLSLDYGLLKGALHAGNGVDGGAIEGGRVVVLVVAIVAQGGSVFVLLPLRTRRKRRRGSHDVGTGQASVQVCSGSGRWGLGESETQCWCGCGRAGALDHGLCHSVELQACGLVKQRSVIGQRSRVCYQAVAALPARRLRRGL